MYVFGTIAALFIYLFSDSILISLASVRGNFVVV